MHGIIGGLEAIVGWLVACQHHILIPTTCRFIESHPEIVLSTQCWYAGFSILRLVWLALLNSFGDPALHFVLFLWLSSQLTHKKKRHCGRISQEDKCRFDTDHLNHSIFLPTAA